MYLSKTVKLSCLDNIESILFGYDMILFNPSACLSPIGSRRSFVAIGGWSHSRSLCPGFSRRPRRRLGHDGIGDEVRYVVLTLRWFRRFCWRGGGGGAGVGAAGDGVDCTGVAVCFVTVTVVEGFAVAYVLNAGFFYQHGLT